MDFVFLPCHVLEALASKKKNKGKKEPKAAKPQGRNSIHHLCNVNFFLFSFSFSLCLYISKLYSINFTAEDDNDDMFKPPKLEDEDFSPFGGNSGLFSGGRGLFDDDDEVSYIFFILCILRFQKLATII